MGQRVHTHLPSSRQHRAVLSTEDLGHPWRKGCPGHFPWKNWLAGPAEKTNSLSSPTRESQVKENLCADTHCAKKLSYISVVAGGIPTLGCRFYSHTLLSDGYYTSLVAPSSCPGQSVQQQALLPIPSPYRVTDLDPEKWH